MSLAQQLLIPHWPSRFVGPLDDLSAIIAAAYSTERVLSTYKGICLQLRRDSDGALSNFGFRNNGDLDTGAISTWLAGAGGYAKIWNDQGANAEDGSQATDNNQPLYVANGQNSLPVLQFDGTDYLFHASLAASLSQPYTVVVVATIEAASKFIFSGGVSSATSTGLFSSAGDLMVLFAGTSLNGPARDSNYHLWTCLFNGANSHIRKDGYQVTGNAGTRAIANLAIGARYDGTSPLTGTIKHLILFSGKLTSQQLSIVESWANGNTGLATYSDHKFQVGGDAGYVAAFCPDRREFWRFGGDDTDVDLIQWANIDTWISGTSTTTIANAGGFAVWHPTQKLFYIYGGRVGGTGGAVSDKVYSFNPATEVLTQLAEVLPAARFSCLAGYYPGDGKVYIFGGLTDALTVHDTIWVHDPVAGTITDTTAVLPATNAGMGIAWAEDVQKFFLIGGYAGATSRATIVTYDPAIPATNAIDTGEVISVALENQACAYISGRIYAINGYNKDTTTYSNIIHKITTNPIAVSVLAETGHRVDDDAVAFYDSVTGKIYAGPFVHSSQPIDNHSGDKRVIYEFDPITETLAAEPSLT